MIRPCPKRPAGTAPLFSRIHWRQLWATLGLSPYLQVHEFEALVLTEPQLLATIYEPSASKLHALCDACADYQSPEEIDLGQHSHPKYRVHECVPEYDENIAGPLICESIGLEKLRTRCPHFGEWLRRLESLDTGT